MLVVANLMSNRVIPAGPYVPWNLAVAASAVLAARGATMEEMGFTEWRRGAAWGGVLFLLTAGVLALGVTMPAFNEMYHDRRVSGGTATWLYQAFIRIPFGTAALEETAFRAVLPAVFAVRWGVLRGCVAASVCFGLWHVLPALNLNEVNPTAARMFGSGRRGSWRRWRSVWSARRWPACGGAGSGTGHAACWRRCWATSPPTPSRTPSPGWSPAEPRPAGGPR
ncbi:MAG: CPBP family intramembrane metalloprotease [Acidimicrobiaceae bacterium]|nr:CPBP family intramembrane metalloprotease [Acidimicrobiaceae bacterium]